MKFHNSFTFPVFNNFFFAKCRFRSKIVNFLSLNKQKTTYPLFIRRNTRGRMRHLYHHSHIWIESTLSIRFGCERKLNELIWKRNPPTKGNFLDFRFFSLSFDSLLFIFLFYLKHSFFRTSFLAPIGVQW